MRPARNRTETNLRAEIRMSEIAIPPMPSQASSVATLQPTSEATTDGHVPVRGWTPEQRACVEVFKTIHPSAGAWASSMANDGWPAEDIFRRAGEILGKYKGTQQPYR